MPTTALLTTLWSSVGLVWQLHASSIIYYSYILATVVMEKTMQYHEL